jgi:two-component sensor histidine kinase
MKFAFWVIIICLLGCKDEVRRPDALLGNEDFGKATALIDAAESYIFAKPDSLLIVAEQLQELGRQMKNDCLFVKGERYKARSLWNLGSHSEAMKMAIVALRHAEKYDITSELPQIYAVIGNLHKEKANYEMALEAADKGKLAAVEIRDTSAIFYMNRIKAMFTQGMGADRRDTAMIIKSLNMHLEGVKLAEVSEKFEASRVPYYNNIAQVYVKLDQLDKAYDYVTKAIALGEKHRQLFSLTYSYAWLSQIYAKRGDREKAIELMQKALTITREMKYSFREMEANHHLHTILKQFGKHEAALEHYARYSQLRDSLRVLENVRQVGELQVRYEAEKKDKQILALGKKNMELSRQTALVWSALTIFVLLLAVMIYQLRLISRKNNSLAERNAMIHAQADKLQVLMNELHHRVKNNLQIVSNLLSLQASRVSDEDSRNVIRAGQQRIEAMSLIHRSLYNYEEVNKVNMKEYLSELIQSIMQSFGMDQDGVRLSIACDVPELDIDIAMPLGLIINEWITNAFKHAFVEQSSPQLSLNLKLLEDDLHLEIRDNGRGMDLKMWEKPKGSFGVKLVKVLVRQLNGTCRVYSENGTRFELSVPVSELELAQ